MVPHGMLCESGAASALRLISNVVKLGRFPKQTSKGIPLAIFIHEYDLPNLRRAAV